MLVEKSNLLQRVRVVMIALVAIIGFGTMAMKPATPPFLYTYGVAETAGGTNWQIIRDVTNRADNPYHCDESDKVCTIGSNTPLNSATPVPKDANLITSEGDFVLD